MPSARVGVEDGEVELILARVQVDEQVEHLVHDRLRARVRPVDLVDDDDGREAAFEGLAEHEPRLGQRAFGRVHEQHDPVDHGQRAFHFAAEVGVAGRVHDVDEVVVVVHGRVLGQDRDAALALELVRVHDPLGHPLVGTEDSALVQQGIHERRLAVVDVGHDGDIAQGGVGDLL